jgi:UDP:flavonoid glycosyltransferase YjiC (YdhE family)
MRQAMPLLREMLDSAWVIGQDAQAVVFHPKAMAGPHLAEKLGVPGFVGFGIPALTPTREFANPLLSTRNLGGAVNRLSYGAFDLASSAPYRGMISSWRRDVLGLTAKSPGLVPARMPKLYHYSPRVVPTPRDWDATNIVTGYWFLPGDPSWQPPAALEAFIAAGPPPVYVGFGSMPAEDAEHKTRVVVEAVRRAGQRAVLATGWGGLSAVKGDDLHVLDAAPHDWLFSRMAAVVHHGGAGTTASGLRAGKPTVICPFFGDQSFWGERVHALGVGPAPVPQKSLTAERLSAAINQAVNSADVRAKAEALSAAIRTEDGVACAVAAIHERL